jgi:hypothetical protein
MHQARSKLTLSRNLHGHGNHRKYQKYARDVYKPLKLLAAIPTLGYNLNDLIKAEPVLTHTVGPSQTQQTGNCADIMRFT